MKKRIITYVLVFAGVFTSFSQSVFDKFEDNKAVTSVVVSQKMFEMFSKIQTDDVEAKEFMKIAKKLTGLKVFTTEDETVANQMKDKVKLYIKNGSLQELMRVKNNGSNVRFYYKEGKNADTVSELLMFVDENKKNTVLLTLTGEIDLNKISVLTSKMNLPSELNEVKKK